MAEDLKQNKPAIGPTNFTLPPGKGLEDYMVPPNSQTITWRKGGAQGGEMPEPHRTKTYIASLKELDRWNNDERIEHIKFDQLNGGEVLCLFVGGYGCKWSDVQWYIPCSSLTPPAIERSNDA